MTRVLVIGLDGATFNVIDPLIKKGKLPTISRLMKGGVYGKLNSTIPPASIPAWPSFMTGMNPAKHGCFDFLVRHKNEYYGRLITSKDIKAKTLWRILSDYGKRNIVINVTGTYPPEKINGIIISGFLTPSSREYVSPPPLQRLIEARGYQIFVKNEILNAPKDVFFSELCNLEETRFNVAYYLMKNYSWDFFMVMAIGTDTVQHRLWDQRELIYQYYQLMDEQISRIIGDVEEDTNIIIMSDHGFGELKKMVHINKWLHSQGLLAYGKVDVSSTRELRLRSLQGQKLPRITYFLTKLGLSQYGINSILWKIPHYQVFTKYLPQRIKSLFKRLPATNIDIDWTKTKVYLSSFFGTETQAIMINLKGRDPEGIVEPDEYENLRDYVIKKLKGIKDPETGDTIFENIFKKEEVFKGPYIGDAPDIITLLKGGYQFSSGLIAENIFTPSYSIKGSHRIEGVFISSGPDIKRGVKIEAARLIDLSPTILHIFNIPIPRSMDGRVLKEIFSEKSDVGKRDIEYQQETIEEIERIRDKAKVLAGMGKV